MDDGSLISCFRNLPKAELHMHLNGAGKLIGLICSLYDQPFLREGLYFYIAPSIVSVSVLTDIIASLSCDEYHILVRPKCEMYKKHSNLTPFLEKGREYFSIIIPYF